MKYGVNYRIRHSGQFFYKMTNEDDGINYKITKIPIPNKFLQLTEKTESSEYKPKQGTELEVIKADKLHLPGDRSINLPVSAYFENRQDALEIRSENSIQLLEPTDLIKTKFESKLLDFDVTKHYL